MVTECELLKVSFAVARVRGARLVVPVETADGASYNAEYRYEKRGDEFWAVLDCVKETMPAATPQVRRFDDGARLSMMHEDGSTDWQAEAEQRRREWIEVNRVA